MSDPATCSKCTDLLSRNAGSHPRCPSPGCGCFCRDAGVELDDPDVRLTVAQLCRQALSVPIVSEESPEAAYVNGVVQDAVRLVMREMTGLCAAPPQKQADNDEAQLPALTGEEVEALRELLATERLSSDEVGEVRELVSSLPQILERMQQAKAAPPPRPRPTRLQQALREPEPEEEALPEEPEEPRKVRVPNIMRKPVRPQPMPSPQAMHAITADQSGRAQSMGQRRFNTVAETGTGSSGDTSLEGGRR